MATMARGAQGGGALTRVKVLAVFAAAVCLNPDVSFDPGCSIQGNSIISCTRVVMQRVVCFLTRRSALTTTRFARRAQLKAQGALIIAPNPFNRAFILIFINLTYNQST